MTIPTTIILSNHNFFFLVNYVKSLNTLNISSRNAGLKKQAFSRSKRRDVALSFKNLSEYRKFIIFKTFFNVQLGPSKARQYKGS